MEKDLKRFIQFIFLLPVIPSVILWLKGEKYIAYCLLICFFSLGIFCVISKIFAKNFKSICDKILSFLGKYLSITALFTGYILAVIPTALVMKIVKRDRLRLRKTECSSYWTDEIPNPDKDYERQF